MAFTRRLACCALLWAAVFACDGRIDDSTDGNTSWFRRCNDVAECETGFACICGVCTVTCSTDAHCEGAPGSTCAPRSSDDYAAYCASTETAAGICIAESACTGCAEDASTPPPVMSERDAAADSAGESDAYPRPPALDGGSRPVASEDGGADDCSPTGEPYATAFECSQLDPMTLSDPRIIDATGDGQIAPGETATLTVRLTETSGTDFMLYPGVAVTSDNAGVTIYPSVYWYYGIWGCDSVEPEMDLSFDPSIEPGTVVVLTLRVSASYPGGEACTETASIQVEFTVE
jgi:hypothetical protein